MQIEQRKVSSGFLFGVCAIVIVGVLASAWLYFSGTQESYDERRAKVRIAKLAELNSADNKQLASYGWVSKEKGIARIPVEKAIELVTPELKNKQVQPSAVQVESPYPAGLQTPAAAAPAPAPEAPSATPATPAEVKK